MKLVIDNVSKNFIDPQGKQLSVLENVSLTVHSEEFVALVGPSGCGKSTFLKSLNRMNDLVEGCRISILQQGCCHQAMGVFISQI